MKLKFVYPANNKSVRVRIKQFKRGNLNLSLQVKTFLFWVAYDTMNTTFDVEFSSPYTEPERKEGDRIFFEMIPMKLHYQYGSFNEIWPINKFNLKQRIQELFDYYNNTEERLRIILEQSNEMFT